MEHFLFSGTSQILRTGKTEVESIESNLCMVQKKMCDICDISISSHITCLFWESSPGVPLALNMNTVLGWMGFFKCVFFPLWFQRGYTVPLNLCTLDRSGASQEWESWLLDRFTFSKMGELER